MTTAAISTSSTTALPIRAMGNGRRPPCGARASKASGASV